MKSIIRLAALPVLALGAPLAAQDSEDEPVDAPQEAYEDTVFDGDWLSIGLGVGYGPSYDGSDDYVAFPLPVVQGSLGGIGISPRPAGLALDFIPDADEGPSFSFGPAIRLRNSRADQIEDPVVEAAGELDRAVEIGPSAGVSFPGVLNPYDSVTASADVRWDVAGAHDGMVIQPSLTYFTPLSRGIATSVSLGATVVDDDFARYYYSVTPAQSAASGLPVYQAEGGLTSLGVNVLLAFDLDGDVANGGLAAIVIGGYSRNMNDAKDTPYTSIRGDADQFLAGVGLGYTF